MNMSILRLVVEGTVILDGSLSHQIKPGEEVWMIEAEPTADITRKSSR